MARQPIITRTIITTKVNALCLDIENQTVASKSYVIPRTYKNEKAILKYLKKNFEDENFRIEHVLDYEVEAKKRKMTELKFIENSEIAE